MRGAAAPRIDLTSMLTPTATGASLLVSTARIAPSKRQHTRTSYEGPSHTIRLSHTPMQEVFSCSLAASLQSGLIQQVTQDLLMRCSSSGALRWEAGPAALGAEELPLPQLDQGKVCGAKGKEQS